MSDRIRVCEKCKNLVFLEDRGQASLEYGRAELQHATGLRQSFYLCRDCFEKAEEFFGFKRKETKDGTKRTD